MKCSRCGNEVGGAGQYTQKYGFICFSCSSALNIRTCSICGQKFPFSEMVEYNGDFVCKDDYRGRMAQIESYKPKPQPKGPSISGSSGTRIRRPRITKTKEPYEPVFHETGPKIKSAIGESERTEPEGKPMSPAEENAEISKLLNDIKEEHSSMQEKESKELSDTLKELSKSKKARKGDSKG